MNERVTNYRKIRRRQKIEMLYIGFYIWYLVEYCIRIMNDSNSNVCSRIAFEIEAYGNGESSDYLKGRKPYSWIKYII